MRKGTLFWSSYLGYFLADLAEGNEVFVNANEVQLEYQLVP